MNRKLAQWSLFVTMAFTLPIIFFLFQIVLVAPLAAIVFVSIRMGSGLLILGTIHTLIFGPLLWIAARFLVRAIERIPTRNARLAVHLGIIACLVFVAWLGPYSVGGHSNDQNYTWLHTFHPY